MSRAQRYGYEMDSVAGRLRYDHEPVASDRDQYQLGRDARNRVPRSAHAEYVPDARRDPLAILEQQNSVRLPGLIPLRTARMLQDPFAFYRGTAALQAADLAGGAVSGANVVACGDAHIANFGIFASPERRLVFDLNDFDEATVAPWEWDLKRLVTSVVIAARGRGATEGAAEEAALLAAASYRDGLRASLALDVTQRFFEAATIHGGRQYGKATQQLVKKTVAQTEKRTSAHVVSRITEMAEDGSRRIVENPPRLTHVPAEIEESVGEVLALYSETVSPDIALLLDQYTVTDIARRVVGVGSVGTRCFIVVLTGPRGEPLVLQVKEATESVLHQFGGVAHVDVAGIDRSKLAGHHGYRVTASQRILQAVSDPFLGYVNFEGFGFYVRQFRDRNASFDIPGMGDVPFLDYSRTCATILARAHSRSPAAFIAGYIGQGDVLPAAMTAWSMAYADQSLADFEALGEAAAAGRFAVSDVL
jgi:uncharacterized protein (DUF2252 family)